MELIGNVFVLSSPMQAVWLILMSPFIGSFLGLVVVRWSTGETIFTGRSKCRACGRKLAVRDLVPIVSWVAGRGKCRTCGHALSPVYLICELGALGIALWSVTVVDPIFWLPTCLLGWSLLTLSLIDIREFRLPNLLTGFVFVSGSITVAILFRETLPAHLAGAVLGFAILLLVRVLYARLRKKEGLGQGDEKLLGAGGLWLGVSGIGSALLIATLAALALVVVGRLKGESIELGRKIPFGPFLSLGIWLTWVYGPVGFV